MSEEGSTETTEVTQSELVEAEVSTQNEPKMFDEAYVKSLRDEAAKHRMEKQKEAKEKEALLARIAEFENAQLTESERMQKEYKDALANAETHQSRARNLEVDFQLALAANDPENQIGDVKAAIKLIDRESLEFDDRGRITNLQDALETLKTEYPSVGMVSRTPSAPNTGVTNPAKAPSAKKLTRADLAKMSPQKIVELQEAGELNHLLRGH